MSARTPLDALFAAYLQDLTEMARLAVKEQEQGLRAAQTLVGKLAMETMRLSVYERVFLLPVVADVVPDGRRVADDTVAKLDGLERLATGLEDLDPSGADSLEPLRALAHGVEDLAREQRGTLLPAVAAALPDRDLIALGDKVTPTQEAGATHSHPKVTGGHDLTLWPKKGVVNALRDVFAAEVAVRTKA